MATIKSLGKTFRDALVSPLLVLFLLSSEKDMIRSDVIRWRDQVWRDRAHTSTLRTLLALLGEYPEFRSLYYYRLFQDGGLVVLLTYAARVVYRGMPLLFIRKHARIGRGLFIQHGFSTVINADMGDYCWVNQQVTIGYVDETERRPCLGNHVHVGAGAKVLGGVTLGDHVIVGANAVVVKNVPSHAVVVGVPARIVKHNGVRVDNSL